MENIACGFKNRIVFGKLKNVDDGGGWVLKIVPKKY